MNPHHPIEHFGEPQSNRIRSDVSHVEPRSLRTFTPTQTVIARSAGIYHWTPEGRRLFDFTSGVLVANLGHNPMRWMQRFCSYMQWPCQGCLGVTPIQKSQANTAPDGYFAAIPMTTYNAITPLEVEASTRLAELLKSRPGGARMQHVMWAASGSEAIQKALWAAMALDRTRPMIIATRYGFHGKKGLANAVTGSETDAERDPRVKFISFPMQECHDVSLRDSKFDTTKYLAELDALWHQFGAKIGTLITEPYLGGGGSYHPHPTYLQMIQAFCREHEIVFIFDEVQANFGRTGELFAYETYGLEPDIVVLGKGLGNGVPVAAAVGRADLFGALDYGEGSDTWSANPLNCAAVLATLDEFAASDVLASSRKSSAIIEAGLVVLKSHPFVANIRGERGGMVWGVEMKDHAGRSANEWANAFVLHAYQGDHTSNDGIHLLGPLAKKVVRISPPLVISEVESYEAVGLLQAAAKCMK